MQGTKFINVNSLSGWEGGGGGGGGVGGRGRGVSVGGVRWDWGHG